jgi:hypothetical protein
LTANAQDPAVEHRHETVPLAGWQWTADANVFVGYNYQPRHFADFPSWESQNWFMLGADRTLGRDHVSVQLMISLEPFTMHAQGSPQLFQTGECCRLEWDLRDAEVERVRTRGECG